MNETSQSDIFERHQIVAHLGRGGMADVYLAASHGPNGFTKLFVIKALHPALSSDEDFVAMFLDEARLAARLSHPNIVSTFEVGESRGRYFIVMEYLEGQPLGAVSAAMPREPHLRAALALTIGGGMLCGLHYAHELCGFDGRSLGVVHRDITPQNILVTYDGQVKVVDFGIAKARDASSQTRVGTVKGNIGYMAPEQARGEQVDGRADVFSAGVVLWELLAGRRLWAGLRELSVVAQLKPGGIPHLREVQHELPEALGDLVMRALHPDPLCRPQTALAFHQGLEAAAGNLPEGVAPQRLGELLQGWFSETRAEQQRMVGAQIDRLSRQSSRGAPSSGGRSSRPPSSGAGSRGVVASLSVGAATPPGGWNLRQTPDRIPRFGAESAVHDAVTAVHAEWNVPTPRSAAPSPFWGEDPTYGRPAVAPGVAAIARPNQREPSSVNEQASVPRGLLWVTIGAVGVAGVMVGIVQPWRALPPFNDRRSGAPTEAVSGDAFAGTSLGRDSIAGTVVSGAAAPQALGHAVPTNTACDSTQKPLVELTGEIGTDAELSCDKDYLLRFTSYVTPGATLKIQPGTRILGDPQTKGILVVQPGGRIEAVGTPQRPIILTSAVADRPKRAGDWGGLVILGEAPTNLKNASGAPQTGRIEGLATGGEYGGHNGDDSSGILSYVRIEYSGTALAPNNEINGLTLGGVGRGTVIDHIQVRHTADDCFEFFGGTVDAKYLICQSPGDDGFDWDYGYTGRLQFLVAQASTDVVGDSNGLEGDNDPNGSANAPVSSPLIYNLTLCGKNRRLEGMEHYAILLHKGSGARIRNGLFQGFSAGLDVRDEGTRPNIMASTFFGNLGANLAYVESSAEPKQNRLLFDDDGGFDERAYLTGTGMKIAQYDPRLGNCYDVRAPGLKPRYVLLDNAAIPPKDGFFDSTATFVGAFRDQDDQWDAGNWVLWGP